MKTRRHPSTEELRAWLDGGEPDRIGRHVDACERCLATLDQVTDLSGHMVAELTDALAAPTDLEDRTAAVVERRLRDEAALTSFLDLFAIGWGAAKTVLDLEEEL